MRFQACLTTVAAVASLMAAAPAVQAKTFKDFLVMNVCLKADGSVDNTKIPGQVACTQRNLNSGEASYYKLRDYPNTNGTNCRSKRSSREMTNMYAWYNGKVRALGYTDMGYDPNEIPSCPVLDTDPHLHDRANASKEDRASVRWVETQEGGIGFLMASGDGADLSYFTSSVCNTFPDDSRRFYDGWPLASVALPTQLDAFQWRFQQTKLDTAENTPPGNVFGDCPNDFHSGFTMWALTNFKFKSGITAQAYVTNHYSNQQNQVANPGLSKEMERAFFTDEWGFSRYEMWRREDYYGSSAADRQKVKDEAAALYSTGRCGKPYDMPATATPVMTTGPLVVNGSYAEKVTHSDGTSEYWYVANCRDYTWLKSDPTAFLPSLLDLDPNYLPFWH